MVAGGTTKAEEVSDGDGDGRGASPPPSRIHNRLVSRGANPPAVVLGEADPTMVGGKHGSGGGKAWRRRSRWWESLVAADCAQPAHTVAVGGTTAAAEEVSDGDGEATSPSLLRIRSRLASRGADLAVER